MRKPLRKQPVLLLAVAAALIWAWTSWSRHSAARKAYLQRGRVDLAAPAAGAPPVKDAEYPASNINSDSGPKKAAAPSKHMVVATLEGDDTSWIQKRLRGWGSSVYVANNQDAALTVPVNKGREAQVYLTFIIDNYDKLPDVMAFVHGRQFQWHNDDPNYDGATAMSRVQVPYILEQGYVNLRCVWVLGCPDEVRVREPRPGQKSEINFREGFEALFPGRELPEVVGASCCAQFALARWKVLEKPRAEYIRIRKWLTETRLDDDISGRIMEYSWHMLFGMPPVHCPDAQECYCNVFGMCDLEDCTVDQCPGKYRLPEFSSQPEGWAPLSVYNNVSYEAENKALELGIAHDLR